MPKLRRATVADAADLVRLRSLMLAAMGQDVAGGAWQRACEAAFVRRLGEPEAFAAFVVELDGRIVTTGVGFVEEHLPSPGDLTGRRGHIVSMSTEPAHRRQGHAQAVLEALLGWFAEHGVERVELRATGDGRALYERAGFSPVSFPTLRWTAARS